MKIRYLITSLMLFSLLSCENKIEDFDPGSGGREYFPLEVGNSWTYQLDSIIYDNKGSRVDTISQVLREDITESYTDPSGDTAYRVARYRQKTNGLWEVTDIWSASLDDRLAYRTEENLRFAKLSFPVEEGVAWDGNAFMDEEVIVKVAGEPIRVYQNWGDYRYVSAGVSESIGDLSFDAVCTVEQVDLEDKITRRYSMEKYAAGVGLIYREMIILNTQQFDSEDPWEEKAEEGFILRQSLISFQR